MKRAWYSPPRPESAYACFVIFFVAASLFPLFLLGDLDEVLARVGDVTGQLGVFVLIVCCFFWLAVFTIFVWSERIIKCHLDSNMKLRVILEPLRSTRVFNNYGILLWPVLAQPYTRFFDQTKFTSLLAYFFSAHHFALFHCRLSSLAGCVNKKKSILVLWNGEKRQK